MILKKFDRPTLEKLALLYAIVQWGRGTICVFREHDGKPAVMRLHNQTAYKEWGGCFSLIEV